jgi:hypothetical protein
MSRSAAPWIGMVTLADVRLVPGLVPAGSGPGVDQWAAAGTCPCSPRHLSADSRLHRSSPSRYRTARR